MAAMDDISILALRESLSQNLHLIEDIEHPSERPKMNTLDTIPPEIRLDIFKQLLPSSNITYVGATRDGLFDVELNENNAKGEAQGIWPSMGNVTHLLGVCRLFDNELSPLIYKNKIFYVRNAPDSLLQTAKILKNVRPENLELIKGVILNYQICTHDAFSRNVNWSTISERDHGEVVEKPKMLMAKKKFCRAAANKLRFLSIRVETRNCQWLTAATFSAKAAWLKDLLKIPGIAIRWLSVESPLIPRDPENETRAAFKKRIEDRLHVKGVRVRVQPPGGNYFADRTAPAFGAFGAVGQNIVGQPLPPPPAPPQ